MSIFNVNDVRKAIPNASQDAAMRVARIADQEYKRLMSVDPKPGVCRQHALRNAVKKYRRDEVRLNT